VEALSKTASLKKVNVGRYGSEQLGKLNLRGEEGRKAFQVSNLDVTALGVGRGRADGRRCAPKNPGAQAVTREMGMAGGSVRPVRRWLEGWAPSTVE